MSVNVFRGDAQPIPQVWRLTPTALELGDVLTVTINLKDSTYTVTQADLDATSGVVASVCVNLAAQLTTLGQTVPEFGEVTWVADGEVTGQTDYRYITCTGPDDGTPFILTTSGNDGNGVNIEVLVVQNGSAGQNEIQVVTLGTPTGGTFTLTYSGQTTAAIAYDETAYGVMEALCDLSNILGTNEIQLVTISGGATGGTFTLTYSGQTTAGIAWNATPYAVRDALCALSNIGGTNEVQVATVNGGPTGGTFTFTFSGQTTATIAYNATADTVRDTLCDLSNIAGTNEVQVLTSTATGGTFTATFEGQTTGNIAFDATAATIKTALEALSNIAVDDVTCTGGPLNTTPVNITFRQALGRSNRTEMTIDNSLATGGTVVPSTSTAGVNADVTVSGSAGGPWTITFTNAYGRQRMDMLTDTDSGLTGGTSPTVTIAESVPGVNADVTVTGADGGPWTVTFVEALGRQNVALMTDDETGLTGGTPVVTTTLVTGGVAADVTVTGADGGPWTVTFVSALANTNVVQMSIDGSGLVGADTSSNRIERFCVYNSSMLPNFALRGNSSVSAGTFTITITVDGNPYTTTDVPFDATLRDAILAMDIALSTIPLPGGLSVAHNTSEQVYGVARFNSVVMDDVVSMILFGRSATPIVSLSVSLDSTLLTGGSYSIIGGGTVVATTYPNGDYRLRIGPLGSWTTYLNVSDNFVTVREALAAIPEVGGIGNVLVTPMNGGNDAISGFEVEFFGDLEQQDLPDMEMEMHPNGIGIPHAFAQVAGQGGGVNNTGVTTTQNGVASQNEIQKISLAEAAASGTFTLTYSGQTTAAIAYNASAATVDTELEALSNIAVGDVGVTGSAGGPWTVTFTGALAATNVVTITGNGASLVPLNPTGFTNSVITAPTGPNYWNEPENWTLGTAPANSEDVVLRGEVDIKFGLSNAAINPAKLIADANYTGEVGLPRWNSLGYYEYRDTALRLCTDGSGPASMTIEVGEGDGEGSPLFRLNTGNKLVYGFVKKTGSSSEANQPAFNWIGTHASSEWDVLRGDVGIAAFPGEVATFVTLRMSAIDSVESDAQVVVGSGVTAGSITKSGGSLLLQCASTSLIQYAGDTTIVGSGDQTVVKVHGGSLFSSTTGILGHYGTITGATQANPCVITDAGHGLTTGDRIRIAGVVGMTQLNQVEFTVNVLNSSTFQLVGIDSTAYTAYSSAGTWGRITSVQVTGNGILDFGQSLQARAVAVAIDVYGGDAIVKDSAKKMTTTTYLSGEFAIHFHFTTRDENLGTDFIQVRRV